MSEDLSRLLWEYAAALDIPDDLHDEAVLKYENVGVWLSDEGSPLLEFTPSIYPQGSFRLGTVVRPIHERDEYDIDLVCRLDIIKTEISQADLKEMVGSRLKRSSEFGRLVSSKRRCWSLSFPNQFHIDVLPSIPNLEEKPDGILLTDTKLTRWQFSNPVKYAEWFKERMKVALIEKRAVYAQSKAIEIAEVPDWEIKTPLQRVVQLFKRHRDIHFLRNPDVRPVSVLLTTLAAQSYANQADMADATLAIVNSLDKGVQRISGRWVLQNPAEPNENFADKWNEKPELPEAFFKWVEQLKSDFGQYERRFDLNESLAFLSNRLGKVPTEKVATALNLTGIGLRPTSSVPALADASHARPLGWPIKATRGRANVKATVHIKKNGKLLWNLTERPLPKDAWIKFRLSTNVHNPDRIIWQVVNTGTEAEGEDGGLRGGFYDSNGGNFVRWENTKYRGTHWVEAFVVKDGACVASSGRYYVRVR